MRKSGGGLAPPPGMDWPRFHAACSDSSSVCMGGRVLISQGRAGIAADSHPPCISRRGERQWRWLLPTAPPAVLTVLVALLGTLLLAAEARTQDFAADRAALVALYNATDGPNWNNNRNWLSDKPLDQWYGVTVQNGRVTRLFLGDNQMTGPIPSELGNLANLQELNLRYNQLTGPIPPELGNLANLEVLFLLANQLTGPIPPELGNLANLEWLSFSGNQLRGSIPSELGKLANLEWLILSNNRLTGAIPPELSQLANLEWLSFSGNQLTGSIPSELGDLANLQELNLLANQLTGPIPPELSHLTNLQQLILWGNQLTGSIPPELSHLANLQELSLQQNRLTGSIPSELGDLANLQRLSLNNNPLTGLIPPKLGNLANLQELNLVNNRLTGSIPPELGKLANLEGLSLAANRLTGSIPSELGNHAKLQRFFLSGNQLTGSMPSELGKLANLELLWLGGNQLTGSIPPELGNLANLETLSLSQNRLTGPIPLSFANLVALERFWFFMNPGLCAGAEAVIRNWLDGIRIVAGPDCSPSITLSATPSNLVEGRATPIMVTATQTAVSNRTSVNLLIGGAAKLGENQDYTLQRFSGSFNALINALIIPANSASGTTLLTFIPLADSLIEGTENIILQAFVGGSLPDLQGAIVGGSAVLTLNDQVGCAPRDRAALEALYHATGGTGWTNRTNWLSTKPLSEWHGVTVDNSGCVTNLDLSNNRLAGTLPLQLGYLVNLEGLILWGNRLSGIIPPSFTNLVALRKFWFHLNSALCAQADASIRTWLHGVGDVRGLACLSSETTSSIFVPVLLTSAGRNNSFFASELALTNRGGDEATLHYTYTPHVGGGSGTATDRLAPGQQNIESNALEYLMRLGVPIPETGKRIGTLRVEVTGSSKVSVVTRTTTAVPDGRAGLAYPGIAQDEGFQEAVYLCGLRENTQDRSNLALQNMGAPGEGAITLRTTVFSGEADDSSPRELKDVTLKPGEFHQYNEVLKVLGSTANGYVKVERVDGTAPFYAYGVINDNFNSDGSFVFPLTESSLVGRSGQTLPVIIETGAFQSELTLTNFSASEKQVDFSFGVDPAETGGRTATFSLKLKAGEQSILPNLVSWLRQQGVAGIGPAGRAFVRALFATPAEGDMSGIVIGARTGSPDQRGGQYSLFYNGVPYGSASVESAWIYGLQQNAENRSNLALVNTGEVDSSDSIFNLEIYNGMTGRLANIITGIRVPAQGWYQINSILGDYAPGTTQGYVRVRKVSGANPFLAYGVINDGGAPGQRSGDGAYLPARE